MLWIIWAQGISSNGHVIKQNSIAQNSPQSNQRGFKGVKGALTIYWPIKERYLDLKAPLTLTYVAC